MGSEMCIRDRRGASCGSRGGGDGCHAGIGYDAGGRESTLSGMKEVNIFLTISLFRMIFFINFVGN